MVILRPFLKTKQMKMDKRFKDYRRWALVTGAASGMGRIYSRRLALMGYNVIMVDINQDGLAETERIVKEAVAASSDITPVKKADFKSMPIVQDLSKMDAADAIYARTQENACEVEVLVNNAGIM